MCNEDGSVWLTFNGEIYNFQQLRDLLQRRGHEFASDTDSEVIIHAYEEWGESCVERFNGMFAFGLWDIRKRSLILGRDRLGIKPLYYWRSSSGFVFASEPKAIVRLDAYQKAPNPAGLICYLVHGYVGGGMSAWEGIEALTPGTIATVGAESPSCPHFRRYWSLDPTPQTWGLDEAEREFDVLLADSVSLRLVTDVPLSSFLSGGIDSSSIAWYAQHQSHGGIDSVGVGFADSPRSEANDAAAVASFLGTRHETEVLSSARCRELLPLHFQYQDEPFGDSSAIPTFLLCTAARRHGKVALSGDGGDELMAGYRWYRSYEKYRRLLRIAPYLGMLRNFLGERGRILSGPADELSLYRRLTSPRFSVLEISRLFPSLAPYLSGEEELLLRSYDRPELNSPRRWQYLDTVTFLVDDILRKVDRASMACSLEVRVPFLDYRLVEFAFSLPDSFVVEGTTQKRLLRRVMRARLPNAVFHKPKQGFSFPVFDFFPQETMVRELRNGEMIRDGFMSVSGWEEFLQRSGDAFWPARLWLLWVLERWYEEWLIN